ncbi:MAG: hypothetical protein M3R61_10440 [Chloroflexota bacterium]|nr:hypothetical protein [Chloroflexota bacterium]
MDDTPNGLLLFGIAFLLASLLVLMLWAVNVLPGKVRAWLHMSSVKPQNGPIAAGATDLAKSANDGLQPLATPRKPANDGLALGGLGDVFANDLNDITPAEVRTIIRQQARAEAIVAILKAAEASKVKSAGDQAGLIEAVAGGARTSRPGTPYALLKAAVDELRGKQRPEYVGDMIARVKREIAGEQR